MKISDKELWYLLDVLAVRFSAGGHPTTTSQAAEALMALLPKPSPTECQRMYEAGYDVVHA